MTSHEPKNPRIVLEQDHERIAVLLERLLVAVRADDRELGLKVWARVERAILAHFDVEEMFVFPLLVDGHTAEVEVLRREHADMRRALGEIGLAFELHTVRVEAIEDLVTRLHDHAEREDAMAYVLAERHLPVGAARSVFERLKAITTSIPRRKGKGRSAVRAS